MASNYTVLGVQLMTTGEKAGTWGTLTNTNWDIIEQISGGYTTQAVTDGANTDLSVSDGSTGATLAHRVIELTGSLATTRTVTIPTGADTLATIAGTQTLSAKTLTAAKIVDGGFIADGGGDENLVFGEVSTPVNELKITNAATGSGPILSAISTSTTDTNIDLNITPLGTGRVTLGAGAIKQLTEVCTIAATAATGTVDYDVITQAVSYFTSSAAANWTLNIRGDGSTTLNDIMDTGESLTIAHLVTQGGTAYYNNVVTVDGGANTPEWQGGSAPSEGNINSIDAYTYTVIKTGSAAFTVLASQTQFA